MTAAVTEITRIAVVGADGSTLTSTHGIIAILLAIIFLTLKEFIRAAGSPRFKARVEILNVAIAPLLIAFVFIIALRLGTIMFPNGLG